MAGSRKYTFKNDAGQELAGRLELPAGEPEAYAIFAHCFTCGKDIFAAARISRALAARGFAVLRFDFTGLGASEGEFENTNFSSNVADLVAAATSLRNQHQAPSLIVGHSLGGAAALAAALQLKEIRAVATINAPFSPEHVQHLLEDSAETIERCGEARVRIAGRQFKIQKHFLDDIRGAGLQIAQLGRPLLVFHAPRDEIVGIDNARQIFEAAKHPKSFVSLDDADHLLSEKADAQYVADVLAAWASRYLPPPAHDAPYVGRPHQQVEVRERGTGRFTNDIYVGVHQLVSDEPKDVGGDDLGPSPYELLLAALGSCTAMTMRMYADRKQLPLESVRVLLTHSKQHAKDCRDCETKTGMLDVIERQIEIRGQLTDAQRQRLMEIADKCPVHRTLHSELKVRSSQLQSDAPPRDPEHEH